MTHPTDALRLVPDALTGEAKAAHIAVQRDEAIRIAHRLHQTCESLIYGLPKYLEQTAQTDEENMIGKAWHTFDAAAWQLAALPQPATTEPCFECGSTERIGTACAACNPDLAAAPASPLPEGGGEPKPRAIAGAPRDGTMLRLWVRYPEDGRWTPLEDAYESWTVGFNNFDNTEDDRWQVVGWCWSHDHLVEAASDVEVLGWLPFHGEAK